VIKTYIYKFVDIILFTKILLILSNHSIEKRASMFFVFGNNFFLQMITNVEGYINIWHQNLFALKEKSVILMEQTSIKMYTYPLKPNIYVFT